MEPRKLYIDDWKHDCDAEIVSVSVLFDDPERGEYDEVEGVRARRGEVGADSGGGVAFIESHQQAWVLYAGTMQDRIPAVGALIKDSEGIQWTVERITDLQFATRYLCACVEVPNLPDE